jgi:hypothetical protein
MQGRQLRREAGERGRNGVDLDLQKSTGARIGFVQQVIRPMDAQRDGLCNAFVLHGTVNIE